MEKEKLLDTKINFLIGSLINLFRKKKLTTQEVIMVNKIKGKKHELIIKYNKK